MTMMIRAVFLQALIFFYAYSLSLASTTLKGKDFMTIAQLSDDELTGLVDHAIAIKKSFKANPKKARALQPLKGTTMSMIFQKRSTRTRVSTETGMFLLGGHGLFLGPQDVQLGVNECMRDTAHVLSRFNDLILARVYAHSDVEELASHSSVPVINALSDRHHPLQTLADLVTLKEHFGSLKDRVLCWVGDGNNVIHDLMVGAIKYHMHVQIATPAGYSCDAQIIEEAKQLARQHNVRLEFTHNPLEAASNADVIVTDTWISMGQEEEAKQRKKDFAGYQVDKRMMNVAKPTAIFLHCLPRKQEEVSDEVFLSEQSLVFPEAENRMWTVMAVALELLGEKWGEKGWGL